MHLELETLIFLAGIGHLLIPVASAIVPFQLRWREELRPLSRLHRQMYWTYAGYILLSIGAFGIISLLHAKEIAAGGGLARAFSLYVTVFWGIRLAMQGIFDVKEYLTAWWLRCGFHALTLLFVSFTLIFGWSALRPA